MAYDRREQTWGAVSEGSEEEPRYRIGEVTKQLDLGQYTLKHYERSGLVEPEASPESGFRYYTCAQFGQLIYIRVLRNMGFSVEEIGKLLDETPASIAASYESKMVENERRIEELREANRMLQARTSELRASVERPEDGEMVDAPAFEFVQHFRNEQMNEGIKGLTSSRFWRESYERARLAVRIEASDYAANTGDVWWGLLLLESEIDNLRDEDPGRDPHRDTSIGGIVVHVPARRVLAISATIQRDRTFATIREPLEKAAAMQGVRVVGDVYAVLQASHLREDGVPELLMTIFAPVE